MTDSDLVRFEFPEPLGARRIKYRNGDLEWIEEALEAELDSMNDRILDGRGPIDEATGERVETPFASVWDGLDPILARRPMRGMRVLVAAGLAHSMDGHDDDAQRDAAREATQAMPPGLWNDDVLGRAITRALGVAFGSTSKGNAGPPPPPTPAR